MRQRICKPPYARATHTKARLFAVAQSAILIKGETGVLELNQPAKRVVVLECSFLDTLIALGVKPVGAAIGTQAGDRGAPPYIRGSLGGITEISSRAAPNFEVTLKLKPDVIVADSFVHKTLEAHFKQIAPTLMLNSKRGSYDDLMQQTIDLGKLVGRESLARRLVSEQQRLIAKSRAFAIPTAPAFVAAVATPTSVTLHSSIGSLLERLGRKSAVKPQGDLSQFEISLEGLVALNPATLVLFTGRVERIGNIQTLGSTNGRMLEYAQFALTDFSAELRTDS